MVAVGPNAATAAAAPAPVVAQSDPVGLERARPVAAGS